MTLWVFDQLYDDNFLLMTVRILVALILSGLIGFERELKNHSAGFRTHILVGVGSCLMMLLSLYGFEQYIDKYLGVANIRFDPARIPAYVVSGIGFLGAGTIIVYGGTIRGLTTAASIWAVAGLGLVVGIGMYATAIFTTIVILLSLSILNNFEKLFMKGHYFTIIEIVVLPNIEISKLIAVLESFHIVIKRIEIITVENDLRTIFVKIKRANHVDQMKLFDEVSKNDRVKNVSGKL